MHYCSHLNSCHQYKCLDCSLKFFSCSGESTSCAKFVSRLRSCRSLRLGLLGDQLGSSNWQNPTIEKVVFSRERSHLFHPNFNYQKKIGAPRAGGEIERKGDGKGSEFSSPRAVAFEKLKFSVCPISFSRGFRFSFYRLFTFRFCQFCFPSRKVFG